MNLEDVKKIYKRFSLMAFLQDGNGYIIDMSSLQPVDEDIQKYCFEMKEIAAENPYTYPHLENTVNELMDAYNNFKTTLRSIVVPQSEVREYQKRNAQGENIQRYHQAKQQLKYAMIPLLYQRQHTYRESPNLLNSSHAPDYQRSNQKTVLNHNNPFSDITIQNQSFIYPGDDCKYKTLQFYTGYTMAEVEDETSNAIVLQPDFKITKTSDRESKINPITMDDSITTKLPDKHGEKELIYI